MYKVDLIINFFIAVSSTKTSISQLQPQPQMMSQQQSTVTTNKFKPNQHVYVATNLAEHNHASVQQPSQNLMLMKRSMSEKSLHSSSSSTSSTSSSCSSSSSASIGSTGSNSSSQVTNHLASSSNYFNQRQGKLI